MVITMSKVTERRNTKIQEALAKQNWNKILQLLDQELENSLRKDRAYGTINLNIPVSLDGRHTEFGDKISNRALDPLETLLDKEENTSLINALLSLAELDQQIIIGRYSDYKSFAQLARETGLSDKTVKKRLTSTTQHLKNMLKEEI